MFFTNISSEQKRRLFLSLVEIDRILLPIISHIRVLFCITMVDIVVTVNKYQALHAVEIFFLQSISDYFVILYYFFPFLY